MTDTDLAGAADELRHEAEGFRRLTRRMRIILILLWFAVASAVLQLLVTVVVLSAVFPGVPVLRINEHSQERQAQVVTGLNCNVQWSNGQRVILPNPDPAKNCIAVYDFLDGLQRHPLPPR